MLLGFFCFRHYNYCVLSILTHEVLFSSVLVVLLLCVHVSVCVCVGLSSSFSVNQIKATPIEWHRPKERRRDETKSAPRLDCTTSYFESLEPIIILRCTIYLWLHIIIQHDIIDLMIMPMPPMHKLYSDMCYTTKLTKLNWLE